MDAPIAIDVRRAQVGAAEIDGANQIILRTIVHALCFSSSEHIESDRSH
jgi:hypothetical protein